MKGKVACWSWRAAGHSRSAGEGLPAQSDVLRDRGDRVLFHVLAGARVQRATQRKSDKKKFHRIDKKNVSFYLCYQIHYNEFENQYFGFLLIFSPLSSLLLFSSHSHFRIWWPAYRRPRLWGRFWKPTNQQDCWEIAILQERHLRWAAHCTVRPAIYKLQPSLGDSNVPMWLPNLNRHRFMRIISSSLSFDFESVII